MIQYLLHSSILLASCFLFYWLFLRKETFFKLNRWILLGSIFLSIALPFVSVPEDISLRSSQSEIFPIYNTPAPEMNRPQDFEVEMPAVIKKVEKIDSKTQVTAVEEAESEVLPSEVISQDKGWNLSFGSIAWYIYLIGLGVFTLAFFVQLIILLTKSFALNSVKDGKFKIVELARDEAPYSFWNSIFINPHKYDIETYEQIIAHEKIHIEQAHFIDKLIAEFALIIFWFNPFVWLYRNAITNNLEFLTDSSMLEKGTEKQTYQLSLLKVSVPQHPLYLTTNYNNSFLKNRIAMMNQKKSSARSSWKYFFLLPLLGLSVLCLNEVQSNPANQDGLKPLLGENSVHENILQDTVPPSSNESSTRSYDTENHLENENENERESENAKPRRVEPIRNGDNDDFQDMIKEEIEEAMDEINIEIPISDIVEEAMANIDINISIEDIVEDAIASVMSSENGFSMEGNNINMNSGDWGKIKPGHWSASIESGRVCFQLNNSRPQKGNWWMTSECFMTSELSAQPTSTSAFFIKRAAGTLNLNGSFNGDAGSGTFSFEENTAFRTFIKDQGLEMNDDKDMFHLFLNNVDKNYVTFMKSQDLGLTSKGLVKLAIHGVSIDDAKDMIPLLKDLGDTDLNYKDLVEFSIHDINSDYVNSIRNAGFKNLSRKDIVKAAIHDVDANYIKEVNNFGFGEMELDDVVKFAIHDVSLDYIKSLKDMGFDNLTEREVTNAAIHDVSPSYIRELKKAGFNDMTIQDAIKYSIHDIDLEMIEEFKAAGFTDMTQKEILNAGIHNVRPSFIQELGKYGFENISIKDATNMAIHNVDGNYIQSMKEMGYGNLTPREITNAKIHNVSPRYIKELSSIGIEGLSLKEIVNFKIHNVDADFVKDLKKGGFSDLSPHIIKKAAIHNVTSRYIKEMSDLGFPNEELDELIKARIHGVDASFIKRANNKGYKPETLREYIRLKISGI